MSAVRRQHLSDADIVAMRVSFATGTTGAELAARYDTSRQYVFQVCRGIARRRAGGPVSTCGPRKGSRRPWRRTHLQEQESVS